MSETHEGAGTIIAISNAKEKAFLKRTETWSVGLSILAILASGVSALYTRSQAQSAKDQAQSSKDQVQIAKDALAFSQQQYREQSGLANHDRRDQWQRENDQKAIDDEAREEQRRIVTKSQKIAEDSADAMKQTAQAAQNSYLSSLEIFRKQNRAILFADPPRFYSALEPNVQQEGFVIVENKGNQIAYPTHVGLGSGLTPTMDFDCSQETTGIPMTDFLAPNGGVMRLTVHSYPTRTNKEYLGVLDGTIHMYFCGDFAYADENKQTHDLRWCRYIDPKYGDIQRPMLDCPGHNSSY